MKNINLVGYKPLTKKELDAIETIRQVYPDATIRSWSFRESWFNIPEYINHTFLEPHTFQLVENTTKVNLLKLKLFVTHLYGGLTLESGVVCLKRIPEEKVCLTRNRLIGDRAIYSPEPNNHILARCIARFLLSDEPTNKLLREIPLQDVNVVPYKEYYA